MEAVLRAIAEPRRRKILQLVSSQELSAGEIAACFEVTRPAISQHLTVLKHAGLIVERREGTRRIYRARPDGLAELRGFLDEFWAARLDRLKSAAEQAEQTEKGCKR
jgi:DNA-binding transcriptional ArsR family regulator